MKKLTLDDHMKAVETEVEMIAHIRRVAEVDGLDMEEFDKRLNALCDKYHEKFAKMDELGLALHGFSVIVKAGFGDKLISEMMEDKE